MNTFHGAFESESKHSHGHKGLFTVLSLLLFMLTTASFGGTDGVKLGKITGRIIDGETGEGLVGVTVALKGTKLGDFTDLDGNYTIRKVPPGTYVLVASSIGYDSTSIADVEVTSEATAVMNLTLHPHVVETKSITVEAKAVRNTAATVLRQRRYAVAVTDGISAQEMNRSGSGDVAEAMTKVTGASVVDGKHIYIRGLGGRYSSVQLNASTLPSADPDAESAPLDLVPTNWLDNVVVEKTFAPDKPGDFAGGSVDMKTKDYPEFRSLRFSTSTSYNSKSSLNKHGLSYRGSSTDWLGFDNGARDIPEVIRDNPELQSEVPKNRSFINVPSDSLDATLPLVNYMDRSSRSFSGAMRPKIQSIPLNQSYSLSYGDRWRFFERPLGVVASLSYSRSYKSYSDGIRGQYSQSGDSARALTQEYLYRDQRTTDNVLWGGLASLTLGISKNHKLSVNYVYNRDGLSDSRYLSGTSPELLDPSDTMRSRVLGYTERLMQSTQVSGEDQFGSAIRINWLASHAVTSQDEPDLRFFTDAAILGKVEDDETGDLKDTVFYDIQTSRFPRPKRLWRYIDEDNTDLKTDLEISLSHVSKIKIGGAYQKTNRDNREEQYEYVLTDKYRGYNGDVDAYTNDMGLTDIDTVVWKDDTTFRYTFANYLSQLVEARNQYHGTKKITALYGMVQMPVFSSLRFVGGLRYEKTDMFAETEDVAYEPGRIDENDFLPSLNFIYGLSENMNLRLVYSRTLARPAFWEIVPAARQEFGSSEFKLGNQNLRETKINSYDVRWEWFIRPGEILAVSGFYKRFTDPIEMAVFAINNNIQPQNSDDATVYGMELEFRRQLDHAASWLSHFRVGGNLTLVHSSVHIPQEELLQVRGIDPEAKDTRLMSGQSPYIINLDLAYEHPENGTAVNLYYNVFGKRFAFNAEGATPDIYEQPHHQLDLLISQRLFGAKGPSLKLSVKNILNDDVEFLYDKLNPNDDQEVRQVFKKYDIGRTFSIGLSKEIL